MIIPDGQIVQVTNLSSDWARATVDVPLPTGVDVVRADEVLREVAASAPDDEELDPLPLVERVDLDEGELHDVVRSVGREADERRGLVEDEHGGDAEQEAGHHRVRHVADEAPEPEDVSRRRRRGR